MRKYRKRFGERTGIEPIIGQIKLGHRTARNYLKGVIGNHMNAILAAAGFNYRKMLNQIKATIYFILEKLLHWLGLNPKKCLILGS